MRLAQLAGKLAQLFGHVAVHLLGGGGDSGLRHGGLWNQTVFVHQVAQHIPLAAVVERGGKQVGNQAALGRLVERFQNALQEVVGFFQFIIKEGVALGKLEGIEIELFHHREAQAVERGEHPAASALFLIGNLALFEADRKLMDVLARDLVILRAGVDAVSGDRVHGDGVDRILVEGLLKLAEIFHRNIGVHNQSLLQK